LFPVTPFFVLSVIQGRFLKPEAFGVGPFDPESLGERPLQLSSWSAAVSSGFCRAAQAS